MELIVQEIEPGVFLADHPDPTFRPRRVVIGFTDETCTVMDPDATHHSLRDLADPTYSVTRYVPPTLEESKAEAAERIDKWVDGLYMQGVPLSWSGVEYIFDTRAGSRAPRNWALFDSRLAKCAAKLAAASTQGQVDAATAEFPVTVYSMDRQGITLNTFDEADAFQDALYAADMAILQQGGIKKAQVDACSTLDEVRAIVEAL